MKKIVIGIVAHVDAGKTTLSESMLYLSGIIKQLGRVDTGNSFLDFDKQEKNRGITIFSSQAAFTWKDIKITLLDTPGHNDFSTEMERALQVLDYAIVVINGRDGVQSHSQVIWKLLKHYQIPAFIFVNKMDMEHSNKKKLMQNITKSLDTNCIDFTAMDEEEYEKIALTKDNYLDYYLAHHSLSHTIIKEAIFHRNIFPCYFGSALKLTGIESFLDGLSQYTMEKKYPDEFGARVYKITTDLQGEILSHIKVTGGLLNVKDELIKGEKANQIRSYLGTKYTLVDNVEAGTICTVTGLKSSYPGQGLGFEKEDASMVLSSFMQYTISGPKDYDSFLLFRQLQTLSREDPQLQLEYHEETKEITIQIMGEIQIEIFKNRIKDYFSIDVEFSQGSILYKETIVEPVVGIGHFEPLRHYGEVHVLLEPGELGSGLQFFSDCKEEVLSRNYQRAVILHLKEKRHRGVLTGSLLTDVKITLIAGRAHIKHTEGGDFREATHRAVRQGLKLTKSILLEPYYTFVLEIPSDCLSKAIYDMDRMDGSYTLQQTSLDIVTLLGEAPVANMQQYQKEVLSYTKGQGKFTSQLLGYKPCVNQQDIIDSFEYNSEADIENPTGSIFCKQGAGFHVPWNQVYVYAHIKDTIRDKEKEILSVLPIEPRSSNEDEELENIFTKTYGTFKPRISNQHTYQQNIEKQVIYQPLPQCLLVDGYNIIFSWSVLKELAKINLDAARYQLLDMMCNYQGYKNCMLIVVFDGYKVKGNLGSIEKYDTIHVVYTKEAQTADMYIEKATHQLASNYHITVATSDALEQLIVLGHGGHRISARELEIELESISKETLAEFKRKQPKNFNYPLEKLKEK